MHRREFIRLGAAGLILAASPIPQEGVAAPRKRRKPVDYSHLPRWRGFNLLEKFTVGNQGPFQEEDFDIIARWGFDFVRLPMDYRCWTGSQDLYLLKEETLKDIDQAIAWGRSRKIHVNLNFHRAPGYCVNPPKEPLDLWSDEEALKQCCHHWREFAKRYKGIPGDALSFDLLNEPGAIPEETYARVVRALVAAIREGDPDRLIVADGLKWGNDPVISLMDLKVAQSTRGYTPMQISHYKASWIGGSDKWPEPTWPLSGSDRWDRERLYEEKIKPWKALERRGVGVHVGEWGAFQHTPHRVVLAWMKDCLELWQEAGWGWALWNLRGSFGVLNSGRSDVSYEPFGKHRLDRY